MSLNPARPMLAVFAIAAMSLSGCAPAAPTAEPEPTLTSPTESATPEPEPTVAEPVPTSIVISAASISVFDETSTLIIDLPYDGGGELAAGMLTDVLDETPSVVSYESDSCQAAGSTYSWGGLSIFTSGTIIKAPGASLHGAGLEFSHASGVQVYGPNDLQVGASLADVVAADPGAIGDEPFEGTHRITLEYSGGAGPDVTGVLGVAVDDVFTRLARRYTSSATAETEIGTCVNLIPGPIRRRNMIKNMTTTRSTGVSFIAVLSVLALSACFPGSPVADPQLRPLHRRRSHPSLQLRRMPLRLRRSPPPTS